MSSLVVPIDSCFSVEINDYSTEISLPKISQAPSSSTIAVSAHHVEDIKCQSAPSFQRQVLSPISPFLHSSPVVCKLLPESGVSSIMFYLGLVQLGGHQWCAFHLHKANLGPNFHLNLWANFNKVEEEVGQLYHETP
ncbi:uncharacterized protein LACBIDRAFT_334963 [Laccaria bicolor S238N-H82]|uniref:Predicted protein n=1 Tax=Laccaria bicolor (strain S238N-H82 / ATCC MYA-4686) TaxID=486041 RepID=B0E0W7_LACBS|nr:uncharacterized protein LACBIDRAFT_334963 [Laccaria bicolor S238N-H82]EDQ99519.1 predicted protein [Laccaria bicolor S238N-H82]|eukprot:XP_001889868.1 predicted protein [Laccaria bicolor S238N-H82]